MFNPAPPPVPLPSSQQSKSLEERYGDLVAQYNFLYQQLISENSGWEAIVQQFEGRYVSLDLQIPTWISEELELNRQVTNLQQYLNRFTQFESQAKEFAASGYPECYNSLFQMLEWIRKLTEQKISLGMQVYEKRVRAQAIASYPIFRPHI
jgi:hypothetical protein